MARGGECVCGTCYACTLRGKGVQVSTTVQVNREMKHKFRPMKADSWAAGIVSEERPGGFRMPLLDNQLRPMSVKYRAEHRSEVDAGLRQLHSSTASEG